MEVINLKFDENDGSLCKARNCMYSLNLQNVVKWTDGVDAWNHDVLFLFDEQDLPLETKNSKMSKLLSVLKQSWEKAGFAIIEDRIAERGECLCVEYSAHFFRLRKTRVICKSLCTYSKYGKCTNPYVLGAIEFAYVKNVTIESPHINCSKFNKDPHSHDVE